MKWISNKKILAGIAIAIIAGLYGFHAYTLSQFEKAYGGYEAFANKHIEVALIPALAGNPLRQDLNRTLSDVLADRKPPEERIQRAKEGVALLVLAEGSIDTIGDMGKDADAALFDLETASKHIALLSARDEARDIVALAHKRMEIIADIRGLSYRANHHTQEIFDRIIADKGALTADHIAALNRLVPSVEEQFDKRSNLYNELQDISTEINERSAELDSAW